MNELEIIAEEVRRCRRCSLHKTRKNPVPGEGAEDAEIMFVGEAPGRNEDEQGKPFVGAAGEFLTELISMIGMTRDEVFITNVVKCRPPHNRDPKPEEIEACSPFLDRQIKAISPRIIVSLGRHSTSYLFRKAGLEFRSIGAVRGRIVEVEILGLSVKLLPTYHPAASLYNPAVRSKIVEDLLKLRREGTDLTKYL